MLNWLPVSGISADDICVTIDASITSIALSWLTRVSKIISKWNTGIKEMLMVSY